MIEDGRHARLATARKYTIAQIKLGNACKVCECDYGNTKEKLDYRGVCFLCKATGKDKKFINYQDEITGYSLDID